MSRALSFFFLLLLVAVPARAQISIYPPPPGGTTGDLAAHEALTNAHSATAVPTSSRIAMWDASAKIVTAGLNCNTANNVACLSAGGAIAVAQGGTNVTTSPDDNILVGNATTWQLKALATCPDSGGQHLNYDAATNTFSCGTSSGATTSPAGSNTQLQYNNNGAFGAVTGATSNGTALTLVAPVLGTPASATLTNATGLPITAGTTGTLGVARGGTNQTTSPDDTVLIGNDTTWEQKVIPACLDTGGQHLNFNATTNTWVCGTSGTGGGATTPGGSSGQVQWNSSNSFAGISGATTNGTTLTLVAPILGKPASVDLENATNLPLTTGTAGTLPVNKGGTNVTAAGDDNLLLGNGTTWESKTVPTCLDTAGQHLNYNIATNTLSCGTSSGTASAAGSTTQLQFNNAGVLGGVPGATWNGTTLTLPNPALGTPASADLANATNLPLAATTGTLPVNRGGTNLTTATDDAVLTGNGTAWQASALPPCADTGGQHLNYDVTTNAWSCGTTSADISAHASATVAHGSNSVGTPNQIVSADSAGKIAASLIPCNGPNQPACLSGVALLSPTVIPAPTTLNRGGVFVEVCPGSTKQVGHDGAGHIVCATDQTGASVTNFLALSDTPDSYAGQNNNLVRVNTDATALEFFPMPALGSTTWLGLSDTPDSYTGQAGMAVRVNPGETGFEYFTPSAGVTNWLALTDTPDSYSGQVGKSVRVNAAATGLEFYSPVTEPGVTTWIDLVDTPNSYSGQAGKYVTVNPGETALQFTTLPTPVTNFLALTDTPDSFAGQNGKIVSVNAAGTALEFSPPTIVSVPTFLQLPDTPDSYSGQEGKGVRVNTGGTALEFYDVTLLDGSGFWPGSTIRPPSVAERGGIYQDVCAGAEKVTGYDTAGHALCAPDQVGLGASPPVTLPLQTIDGAAAIDLTNAIAINDTVAPLVSSGGPVSIIANPQLPAGEVNRQRVILQGTSNVNTVTIAPGNGTSLTQAVTLPAFGELPLLWNTATNLWDREIIPATWGDILFKPNVAVLDINDQVPGDQVGPMHGHTTTLAAPGFSDCHLPGETIVAVGAGIEASNYCTESAGVPRPVGTMSAGYSTVCGDTGCINAPEYGTMLLTGGGGTTVACTQGALGTCVVTGSGGGSAPGGADNSVQYRVNSTTLGGITGATTNGTVMTLTSPVFITPALGTPASADLANATNLPIVAGTTGTLSVARGGTGITSFASGIATWLGTSTSANLAAAVTDEAGSGPLQFGSTRYWPLSIGAASTDGVQCGQPTAAILNTSKPVAQYVICTNNTAGRMSWDFPMPANWNAGAVTVKFHAYSTTNQNGLTVVLSAQGVCVGDNEQVPNESTSGEVNTTLTFGNQTDDEQYATSGNITMNSSCAAGDHVYFHVDIDSGTATFANVRILTPMLIYTVS